MLDQTAVLFWSTLYRTVPSKLKLQKDQIDVRVSDRSVLPLPEVATFHCANRTGNSMEIHHKVH